MSGQLEVLSDGGYGVRTPYDPGLLPVLRGLPGAKWDREVRVWRVSADPAALTTLLGAAKEHGWVVDPAILRIAQTEATQQEAGAQEADRRAETPGLYPFQREGVRWLARRERALLADEMGCVDGDAIVQINRAGASRKVTLRELYFKFNGLKGRWDPSIETFCRALCDGELRQHKVKAVLKKGLKDVVRITLASGKTLRVTPDHEICVAPNHFIEASKLSPGSVVLTNGRPACLRCASTSNVSTYTYAKFKGHCRRCMYRYLRAKPTWNGGRFVDQDGYVRVSGHQEHPRANRTGAVYEHILAMETHLGRRVTVREVVHHKNGIKSDNRIENLELTTIHHHAQHHGKNGGYLMLSGSIGGRGGLVRFIPEEDTVVSVCPDGEADVYDIVMEDPHRTFVANGVVVHNCGKTVQTIAALPDNAPVLVICPASIKGVWKREFKQWRPDYRVSVLSGRGAHRWPEPGEVVVENYDILPKAPEKDTTGKIVQENDLALLKGAPEDLVLVVDEVHACKGAKTRRTRAVKYLSQQARKTYGLTGTPLLNRQPELWQVLETVGVAEEAFTHFGRFYKIMGGFKTGYGTEWGKPKPECVPLLKRVMLRRKREEVLPDLPGKTYKTVPVENLKRGLRARLDEALAAWQRREGLEGHDLPKLMPPFEELAEIRAELAAAKIPTMLDLVAEYEEQEEPLVVFSAHRAPVDVLAGRPGWARISGEETDRERTEIVSAFQEGRLKGVALTIGAGREGLTLTRASQMLFVDLAWTPAWNSQAQDRICRIGQTRGCVYTTLVARHPVDERLEELLQDKQDIINASVEAAATRTAPLTLNEVFTGATEASENAAERQRQERARMLAAGLIRNCPKCDKEVTARKSHSAKNPGRLYFACRPCDWFAWADEKEEAPFEVGDLRSGAYALDREEGGTAFYLVQRPTEGNWAGWTFLSLQLGPEAQKLGAVDPHGRTRGASNVRSILTRIMADPKGAMARYGRELGICGACGLPLTNEQSREIGIGPVCAARF